MTTTLYYSERIIIYRKEKSSLETNSSLAFGHVTCLNTEEEFVSEEDFSLRHIIILSEYYKFVVKVLSDEGL